MTSFKELKKSRRFGLGVLFCAALCALAQVAVSEPLAGPYQFYAVSPCRAVDTRTGLGGYTGMLLNGQTVGFPIKGACGVPADAYAVSLNVTIADTVRDGWFALFPVDTAYGGISTINFGVSDTIANGAIVPLAVSGAMHVNALAAFAPGGQGANLILDITGYFK